MIGGLVDSSVIKQASRGKATGLGVRCMRLPLAEHAPVAHGRLPLTLTSVLQILLEVHAGGEWEAAVRAAVAPRLLRPPTYVNSRSARRKESREIFNSKWESGVAGGGAAGATSGAGGTSGEMSGELDEDEVDDEGDEEDEGDEDEDELDDEEETHS